MYNSQTIKCDVYNCKHCIASEELCELNKILVSNQIGVLGTRCASFEEV